jgi:DNA segregation ATPase FtsK/SpoIIIE-like protein
MHREPSKHFGLSKTPAIAAIAAVLLLGGCGDFFAAKPTAVQSLAILDELGQVRESPHVNNPLPEIYRQPPSRLTIKDGVKLFYYTRHHPAGTIAALVKEQMGIDASVNAATNQLVLFCKDDAQATLTENYLTLIDVPPVQVNVDCLILERFGDITTDWETSIMIENFLGEGITLGEARGTFNNQGVLTSLDPAFPGAAIRETERAKFGLDFGYWIDKGVPGHQVRAVVDVLISQGYLKILLNPTLETVNGQKATVTIKDLAPIEEVQTSRGGTSSVYNITQYTWVENTLTVTPFVYSDGSIGLTTDIKIGSRSKPEGVVQRAIITERSINVAENRVLPGQSLIIGGMRKSEKRSVIRGIPFFKDLPLIGILFSSKDFEEKGTEIIYILTPSISSGGQEHSKVVQDIRRKHADPEYKAGLKQMLTEPFDSSIYGTMVEKQAADAELKKMEAEMEREQAMMRAQTEKDRADRASAEAEKLRKKAEQMAAQAQKAAAEAQKAAEQAAAATTQTESQRKRALELQQQKDKAHADAQQAQQAAAAAAQEAQTAAQKAQQAQQQLEQSRQAAEKAAAEVERVRTEALKRAAEQEAARKQELQRQEKARQEAEQKKAQEEQAQQQEQTPQEQSPQEQPAPQPSPAPAQPAAPEQNQQG